jgi:hypothetical protein
LKILAILLSLLMPYPVLAATNPGMTRVSRPVRATPTPTPKISHQRKPRHPSTPTPTSEAMRGRKTRRTPTQERNKKKPVSTPTPTPSYKKPKPTATVTAARAVPKKPIIKRRKRETIRYELNVGGGLAFPDSDRFDSKGGVLLRAGMEVFAWRYWSLGVRGQADQFEWLAPDAADPALPYSYRLTRVYEWNVFSRILFKSKDTKPYILGGAGVFKTEARGVDPTSVYPHKGPFYPIAFGVEFELNPKWLLGVEYQLLFLEDRTSHHVTQLSNLAIAMGFGFD